LSFDLSELKSAIENNARVNGHEG